MYVHLKALNNYLKELYGAYKIDDYSPFLFLWCENGLPPPHERPFFIAGRIAMWLNKAESIPGDVFTGRWASSHSLSIDDDLLLDLSPFHMPRNDTLLRIAVQYFPGASAISFVFETIIVEYPEEDERSWSGRFRQLPHYFYNTDLLLRYTNGPLATAEVKGLTCQQRDVLAGMLQADCSEYVNPRGCFFSGAMLQAQSGYHTSSGIAVTRGNEKRLTVALHCWQLGYRSMLWKPECPPLSDLIPVESSVDYVNEQIGITDIGLAQLNPGVPFQNRFISIPATAKTFLPSTRINVGDEFLIDNFVTATQRLRCHGKRIQVQDDRALIKGTKKDLRIRGNWISRVQLVLATGSREMLGRAAIPGTALVRVKKASTDDDAEVVLKEGEIGGFMLGEEVRRENRAHGRTYDRHGRSFDSQTQLSVLWFADAVDDLIEDGWRVVQVPEESEDEGSNEEEEEDADEMNES